MNDGFRQRLVGAVVLLCLGLIAWPLLFSESSRPVIDRNSQIPPMPEFETFSVPQPDRPEVVSAVADEEQASPATAEPSAVAAPAPAEPTPRPQLDSKGLPQSWVLQVASLARLDSAQQLRDRLRAQGFKAYIKTSGKGERATSRVLVGPYVDRAKIEQNKAKIDKSFGVDAMVVRFVP